MVAIALPAVFVSSFVYAGLGGYGAVPRPWWVELIVVVAGSLSLGWMGAPS